MNLVLIAIGGALGALSRFGLDRLLSPIGQNWHWGTFAANLLGCLMIGLATGWLTGGVDEALALRVRSFLLTGFIASFTTFSTFALQALGPQENLALRGVVYAAVSVVAGVVLCWIGLRLGRLM